ncbi:MAG: hypothetical protein HN469_08730 [Candidatus Marinimicrobia bacterium]|nr:hypothetical protein [Candidatus Neomarinimicrobiota bacterium]MBT3945738.1 hypothetical protein [Candidatus Neomarinimicrobiota bacterium]MBT5115142.1 hypothetical protein [Candidatus Neomarinimicrobiota bacterium]
MIKIKFFRTVTVFLVWISMVFSQIKFDVSWTPYVTYYLSMVDINTGESNMPIFLAELSRESGAPDSVGVDIEFEIIIASEALGVNNETLVKVETTQPIFLSAPIHLTNMDLNLASDQIFDDYGNNIPLHLDITEQLDIAAAEDMFSAIVQNGQLPNGVYTFRVIATAENGQQIIKEDILNIANPFMLQLVSPGGMLADTTLNEVYTSFPVLQWESDPCNYTDPTTGESGCQYYIRLAEFISDEHSSMGQAIESVTRLPLDQSQGFEQVGFGVSTFQYPTDAGDLVPGKIYVWQVRKDITTTSGTEEIFSDIMAFKVKDFTSTERSESSGDDTSPAGMALRSLIGDELVNRLFGDGGDANGMIPNGTITLDGESVDISFIQSIVSMGIATEDENGNETYRAIQIRSVEVSE